MIVIHEAAFAQKVASRLIFIDKGHIAEDGDPDSLRSTPPSERLREFLILTGRAAGPLFHPRRYR